MKELIAKKPNYRRICSVRGCGNRDTVLFARSVDMAGGLFICKDCAEEMYRFYFPEVVSEAVALSSEDAAKDAIVPEVKEEKPAVRARTGTKSGAKGEGK